MAARSFLYGGETGGGGGLGVNSVLLTNKRVPSSSSDVVAKPLDSFFVSGASHSFAGSRSFLSFEDGGNGSGRPFFQTFDQEDNGDDEYDEYFHHPEKKRRLKADQVQFLEKSFESENKLEPERKIQLAKDLGLQPRQIAIWFQNRRARWKTKQLEKDYDLLQESYNELKANYDNLLKEKEKLKSKVLDLSNKLLLRVTEKGTSDSSSSKCPSEPLLQDPNAESVNDDVSKTSDVAYGQEDNVAVKSVGTESGSPRYVSRVQSFLEQDQSDESVEVEEDNLEKMYVAPVSSYMLPKIEMDDYPELDVVNSCYLGLPGNDHEQSFGFWSLLS